MRTEGCEAQTLRALASMPFLDRTEMVAVTGWSKAAVHEAVDQLDSGGFCAAVPHATALFPSSTQRFHLTAAGLGRLAEEEETSLDELVRDRPVSAQWRRNLMRTARLPRRDLPAGGRRLRRRIPHTVPVVQGLDPGRRRRASRRPHRRHRQAGAHRRQVRLLQPDVEAAPGAAPRSRARADGRRRAAQARPQDAGRRPRSLLSRPRARGGRGVAGRPGVEPARGQSLRRAALCPRPDREGKPPSRGGRAPDGLGPSRPLRRGSGVEGPRLSAARHPQARREARPRPHLRLALDHPDGPGRNVGRLGPQGLPAGDAPRRVPPRHPAHRRERAHGPHRPGPGAPGPQGPDVRGRCEEAVERRSPVPRHPISSGTT